MTPRRATRTQQCDRRDAQLRLEHARSFLDIGRSRGHGFATSSRLRRSRQPLPSSLPSRRRTRSVAPSSASGLEARTISSPSRCCRLWCPTVPTWPEISNGCWRSRTTPATACSTSAVNGRRARCGKPAGCLPGPKSTSARKVPLDQSNGTQAGSGSRTAEVDAH